jgi:hypothetical protein
MLLFDELLELATPQSALVETGAEMADDAEFDAAEVGDLGGDGDGEETEGDFDDVWCDVCDRAVPHSDRVFVCTDVACDFAVCQRCSKKAKAVAHPHALRETFNFTFAYQVFDDDDDPNASRRVADTHGALTLLLLSTEPSELNLITRIHIVTSDAVINAADPRPLRTIAIYHAKVGPIEWHVELSDAQLQRVVELLRRFHNTVDVA